MIEALLNKLDRCRATGIGRWMASCPVHEEKTPSLSIRELDDGRVLLYCFGCGAGALDIILAAGLEPDVLFPPRSRDEKGYSATRQRIDIQQAILSLRDEAYFLQATQYWLAAGRTLTGEYQAKLEESTTRIDGICRALGIVQDNKAMGRLLNRWLASSAEAGVELGPR